MKRTAPTREGLGEWQDALSLGTRPREARWGDSVCRHEGGTRRAPWGTRSVGAPPVHLPGGRSWREGSSRVTRQRPPESETRTPEVAPHPRAAGGEAGRRRGPRPLTPPCALPYASQTETATPGTPKSGLLTQERKEGARDHPEEKHKRGRLRVERDPCAGKRRSPFDAATRVESQ